MTPAFPDWTHFANLTPTLLGERLLIERKRLQLSQRQMSELSDVSIPTISLWETGARFANLQYLIQCVEAGADLQFLLLGERTPPIDPEYLALEHELAKLEEEERDVAQMLSERIDQLLTLKRKIAQLEEERQRRLNDG